MLAVLSLLFGQPIAGVILAVFIIFMFNCVFDYNDDYWRRYHHDTKAMTEHIDHLCLIVANLDPPHRL